MNYLVDTNIISELARPRPNPGVLHWLSTVQRIRISVITLEELYYGLSWKPNPRIEAWLTEFLTEACDILDISAPTARLAGRLRGNIQSRGRTLSQADMLIAASALEHSLILVTANSKDFVETGAALLNPFAP